MKTENDMLKKLVQDELEKEAEQIKKGDGAGAEIV